jgi:hypothetical protein
MAAMSYSSATVTNDMSVSLVDTQDALLALEANPEHNAAYHGNKTADTLNIDLDKGNGNGDYGVQPFSVYTWNDLFEVTNNSEHDVVVTIKTNPNVNDGRIKLLASTDGTSWVRLSNIHSQSPGGELTFTLKSGESQWIDIKTDSMNGHVKTTDLKLIVEAEKQ